MSRIQRKGTRCSSFGHMHLFILNEVHLGVAFVGNGDGERGVGRRWGSGQGGVMSSNPLPGHASFPLDFQNVPSLSRLGLDNVAPETMGWGTAPRFRLRPRGRDLKSTG